MYHLDSQHRLTLPYTLLRLVHLGEKQEIGIYYDIDNKYLFFKLVDIGSSDLLIDTRSMDDKYRIGLSKRILSLIGADYNSTFLVYIKQGRLCMSKLE